MRIFAEAVGLAALGFIVWYALTYLISFRTSSSTEDREED